MNHTISTFYDPENEFKAFENIVGKRENAGNQYFSPFPTMFSTQSEREIIISATLNLSSANAFNLDQSEILPFGKKLHSLTD